MATPASDINQWYQIYYGDKQDGGQSLVGTSLYTGSGAKGAVFLSPSNTSQPVQRWQIFPVAVNGSTLYTLRSKDAGPNAFPGTQYTPDEETEGKTRPAMFRGDVAGDNVYWSFGSWGDGTWYLTSASMGPKYRMNKKNNGIMAMSPNITAPQNGERYSFATVAKIDDTKYSSVNLVGASVTSNIVSATTSTSPMSTSNSSPISSANAEPKPSSSGLSTGVKAGIGAAVGGVLLITVVVLGLYFRKKRKQDSQYAQPQELAYEPPAPKYEMYHDSAMKYEMPSSPVVEVPNHEGPAELPGHMPESTRKLP